MIKSTIIGSVLLSLSLSFMIRNYNCSFIFIFIFLAKKPYLYSKCITERFDQKDEKSMT